MYNVQYIFYNEILYNLMYSFGLNPQPVTVTTWVSQKIIGSMSYFTHL